MLQPLVSFTKWSVISAGIASKSQYEDWAKRRTDPGTWDSDFMRKVAIPRVRNLQSLSFCCRRSLIELPSWPTPRVRLTFAFTTAVISMDRTSEVLSKISIVPHSVVSHAASNSPATWRSALANSNPSTPESYELTKTLVFKPKTAKNAIPVPVVVVLREETEMNSAALAKNLKLKELRLASEDLLQEFFALDKDSCTPSPFFAMISPPMRYHSNPSCLEFSNLSSRANCCGCVSQGLILPFCRPCFRIRYDCLSQGI